MGDALFYHLTQSSAEALLPVLIGKSRQACWRVELRGRDVARLAQLDLILWQGEGFVPHGLAGGPHDIRQPVLLTTDDQQAGGNNPACLVAIDGVEVSAWECESLERVCVLFDGNNTDAVEHARGQWRALTAVGVSAQYWSEAGGRWEMKSRSG